MNKNRNSQTETYQNHRQESDYRVGVATADVTPPVGTPMCGFAGRGMHSSTGVYHPLRAVAVVIDDGAMPVLQVSVEWLGFYDLTHRVRRCLSEVTGIAEQQIVLSGTHTHCGPAIRERDYARFGRIDETYVNEAIEAMSKIASIAWQHRFPARLRYGVGRCEVAMCRRVPDPDHPGRVRRKIGPHPDGPTDHDVGVLVVETEDEVVRGILFSYGCHPTSRGGLLLGGDYVGFAYDYLGEAFRYAQPCFLQGCGGDQNPAHPRPIDPNADNFGFARRTVSQVEEIGHELGAAVETLIDDDGLDTITGPIVVKQSIVALETEPVSEQELVGCQVPFELQTITFGRSLAVVAMSGEMTVEHGLRLKRDLGAHFTHVLPLGYTNDIVGYVPVKRQFPEFGYEVLDNNQMFRQTGRYVETTEDQIHDQIHHMLGTHTDVDLGGSRRG